MRQYGLSDQQRMKAMFKRLVGMCGGVEMAAADSGSHKSQISNWGSQNHMDKWAPMSVILDLEAVAGEPLVTREMMRLSEASNHAPDHDPCRAALTMVATANQAIAALNNRTIEAADDNHFDDSELRDLREGWQSLLVMAQNGYDRVCRMVNTRARKTESGEG